MEEKYPLGPHQSLKESTKDYYYFFDSMEDSLMQEIIFWNKDENEMKYKRQEGILNVFLLLYILSN